MQVVLQNRVPKLGDKFDIVNVKPGFARNFLFPKKLAIQASAGAVKQAENWKAKMAEKVSALLQNAKEIAEKLKDMTITFKRKTKGEKLYGSIKESDIAEALAEEHKVEVTAEMVKIAEPIRTAGDHSVKIQLTEDVEVTIKVVIEKEEGK